MPERAQSETLGFVLVFALIVTTIGITFAAGFGTLIDVRQSEKVNNAQRAFEVLADNVGDMIHRTAPSRATEIKVSGATIGVGNPVTVNVSVEDSDFNVSYDVRPIYYDADVTTEVFYSAGAVIRHDGDSGIVVRESTYLLGENRTLIPILETRIDGSASVGGSGTTLVQTRVAERDILHVNGTEDTTVWLNLTTPRAETWRAHLSDISDVSCEPVTGDVVACQVTTDHLYVTIVRIDVQFR